MLEHIASSDHKIPLIMEKGQKRNLGYHKFIMRNVIPVIQAWNK